MGNCLSMFSEEDLILMYDRLLQNDPFLNSILNKKVIKAIYKGTYAGIRNNYGKFPNEKVRL